MSNLKIEIKTHKETKESFIEFRCSNDLAPILTEFVMDFFETEMITGKIFTGTNNTVISFKTSNQEKIQTVQNGVIRMFRVSSKLNNVNLN